MTGLKIVFTVMFSFLQCYVRAQLPVCSSNNNIIYLMQQDGIYNLDLSQPVPVQVLNTIPLPAGCFGLAVSKNLNATSPATTFYTISHTGMYLYYDGTSWVNTNHKVGGGVNIGGGGGFIYNYNLITGIVTRYDGTGDAIPIATLDAFGSVADLAVDCSGNFYYLHNAIPQSLTKLSPSGAVLNVYTVTGVPVFTGGGGLVVFGNDFYYDDLSDFTNRIPLMHGTINGNNINFVPAGINLNLTTDMASCPGATASAPDNVTICNTQLPFTWNGNNYTLPGMYSVTLNSASGCDSIATLNLTINTAVTTAVDTTICSDQLPFNWNGQNYSAPGNYAATLKTTGGCDSIVRLQLTVRQPPAIPVVASPINYCQLQAAQPLSVTATGNLLWYNSPAGGIGTAAAPVPSTLNAGIINYYVSRSVAGCESQRARITVTVFEPPVPVPDKTVRICNGESTDLTGLYNAGANTTRWSLNQVPVADPTTVSTAGMYRYIATNASGCSDTAFINLIVQPAVIAFAGTNDSTELNVPYQLSGSGGLQYQWSPGPPLLNNAAIANPIATLTTDTSFSLIVTDASGCKGYDTVTIKVFKATDIFIPTAFTPNGDGQNDILRPLGKAIKRLDYFRIYNRYGELIFETHDLLKGWDGTYKGKAQNSDNYIWVLKALDRKKVVRTMTGSIFLIR